MDLDRDQNNVPGRVPNFGAIFMSNSATKRECLRRKLFGLPSSQAYFVKQVKAGMVLFLFEFERRELYGVFQACSDGAMNIVPHAFSSSGKQFPAQVKFTTIWYCSPLSEPEFHGAIKDNYFSANKFNFGLSADQVRQLLLLFSSRKLKDCLPQRLLMGSKVTKLIRNSLGKLKRVPDDDKLALSDREEIEHDVENDLGQVMLADYPGNSLGKEGVHNDGRLATSDRVGNKCNVGNELCPVFSTEYPGNFVAKVRRVADDGTFATSDRVEYERHVDNGLGPVILTEYPGYPPELNSPVCSTKPILKISNSLVQDQLMPSALPCSMEPQVSNLSYSTDHGDPNVLSHLPYDPDSPSIQFRQDINAPSNQYRQDPNAPSIPHRHSSSGDNHSSNSVKEHASPLNTAVGNIFPSRDKSFQFHVEPKGISNYPDVTSGIGNDVPLPTPNYCECSYCITSISFSRAGYSENRVADSLDCVGYNDPSFSKLSLASMPISKSGNYGRENISPSAYSLSPSKKSIFASVNEYPVVSQDKYKHKTPWRESNEALSANFPLSNGNRCKLQGGVGSFDSRGVCFRECDSFNCDIKHNQEFKGLYSDFQKKRNSVFSRLTLVPESYHQGNDTRVGYDESDIDTSADEVMEMLHQGHNHWMKKMRKPKLSTRQYDDDEKFRNRRQTTFYSQTMRNHSLLKPKEMNMDGIPDEEESGNVMVGWTQHVDFKRRSEVRKIKDETKKRECVECVESTGSLGMPRKRRKLVRPNFRKSELSCDKGVNGESSPNPVGSSQESSVTTGKIRSHEASVRGQESEDKLSQYAGTAGLQHVVFQINCEGSSTDVRGGSQCITERKTENCGASFSIEGEDGKELAQNVGTENVLLSDSCKDGNNAEEGSSIEDSVVDGLSPDYNKNSVSNVQESSPGLCEGDLQSGTTLVGIEHDGNNEKLLKVVENVNEICPVSCEIAIGKTKNSSSDQNLKSESVLKDLVDTCVSEGKGDELQLTLGSGTGWAKASFETVSCLDTQEPSQEIIDGNVSCGELLATTNGVSMDCLQNGENLNEVLSSYHESTIGKLETISSDQNLKLLQEVSDICASEGKGNELQLFF